MSKKGGQLGTEEVILFLYCFQELIISRSNFMRYVYLYSTAKNFLKMTVSEDFNIFIYRHHELVNNDVNDCLIRLRNHRYIMLSETEIEKTENLTIYVSKLLENKIGLFYIKYTEIRSFLNLVNSYPDGQIFNMFFSEPNFEDSQLVGDDVIDLSVNELEHLLSEFRNKIENETIDEFDIFSHWINFVLKKVADQNYE